MPVGPLRAVVFDFDGTILDSEASIHASWSRVYAEHGASFTEAEWAETIGTADVDHDVFDPARELRRRAESPVDMAAVRTRIRAEQRDGVSATPLPGVRELVDALLAEDVVLGIATAASRGWVQHHLPRLGLAAAFTAWSGRDDVDAPKPAPDVYLRTMELLGADPTSAVAIEDTPNGVSAARAAGMRVAAVPNPLVADRVVGADLLVGSCTELTPARLATLLDG